MTTPAPHAPRFTRPAFDLVAELTRSIEDRLADEVFEALVADLDLELEPAER